MLPLSITFQILNQIYNFIRILFKKVLLVNSQEAINTFKMKHKNTL